MGVAVVKAEDDAAAIAFLFAYESLKCDVVFFQNTRERPLRASAWHVDKAYAVLSHGGSNRQFAFAGL